MARLEKERIIEEGRRVADKMIRDAEAYSTYRLARAKKAVRDQMVDLAVTMAEDRLVEKMTEEDNRRIVERFIGDLASSSAAEKFK
jgi:F0F1-type ATP synthase membrane subunit b/b'